MYESSSAFALFWNILRNQLPKEVIADLESWLEEKNMVRMDTKGAQDSAKGAYTVKSGGDSYVFHGVDMPPPSGYFGTNYSRSVKNGWYYVPANGNLRAIHREGCDHKYGVSWTTVRSPELGERGGANFFICSHAIKVEAAADTVIVWKPASWHGTSLQNQDPYNSKIFQAGLALITPPGVARLWADFLDEKVSLEEARGKILELESDEVDSDEADSDEVDSDEVDSDEVDS
jgi:hypothetical protein